MDDAIMATGIFDEFDPDSLDFHLDIGSALLDARAENAWLKAQNELLRTAVIIAKKYEVQGKPFWDAYQAAIDGGALETAVSPGQGETAVSP